MSDTTNKPIGYINFDGAPGDNNEVEIIVPHDRLAQLRRGQYVLLSSTATGSTRHYLARIIRGPYYVPDAVSKDSAFARASILQADEVNSGRIITAFAKLKFSANCRTQKACPSLARSPVPCRKQRSCRSRPTGFRNCSA